MRGKLKLYCEIPACWRITPADAGKTIMLAPALHTHQDHPRGCGENIIMDSPNLRNAGSPPRMRGKRIGICFCAG